MKRLKLLGQKRNNLFNYIMSLFGENEPKRTLERAEKSHKSAARLPEERAERPGGPERSSAKGNKRKNRSSGHNRTLCWKRGGSSAGNEEEKKLGTGRLSPRRDAAGVKRPPPPNESEGRGQEPEVSGPRRAGLNRLFFPPPPAAGTETRRTPRAPQTVSLDRNWKGKKRKAPRSAISPPAPPSSEATGYV